MRRNEKDIIRRVERAIAQHKESEAMSQLDIEAKQLSEKLESVTVDDAKIYLYAKYQREKRKKKFIEVYDTIRNMILKLLPKLQTFAERYERVFIGQYENTEQNRTPKTENNRAEKNVKNKEKDDLMNWAESIMEGWRINEYIQ